jgi:hypothetical protein
MLHGKADESAIGVPMPAIEQPTSAAPVRETRHHLGLLQAKFAAELGGLVEGSAAGKVDQ